MTSRVPGLGTLRAAGLVAALALAYLLLGLAGLALAIPPGYASPVFPAAGLALAFALRFGRPALAGIWLGSFALNVSHAVSSMPVSLASAAAAVIATGATVQAAAGAGLVRRAQGDRWRRLESEREIIGFFLLGGALATLVSATVSTLGLTALGIIAAAEAPTTWGNWYTGDLLGVIVFSPLCLCFLQWDDGLWRDRRRRTVAPMAANLLLVALATLFAARWEAHRSEEQLAVEGRALAGAIEDRLIAHRQLLTSLRAFALTVPGATFEQFDGFTRHTLEANPDVFALSLNDLVAEGERAEFERRLALSGLGGTQITERHPERGLVRAAPRAEHVVVRYIAPLEQNRPAVGFDISSEPVRRAAIEGARSSGEMAVTAPIRLVQERQERVGILELMPIIDERGGGRQLEGFAVAVVKLDEMVAIATRGKVPAGVAVELTDLGAPPDGGLLHRIAAGPGSPGTTPARWTKAMSLGQREWQLAVTATRRPEPWIAWAVAVAGLVVTALLQILLLGFTGGAAALQWQRDALRASEEQYRSLVETLHVGVLVHGPDGRVVVGNATAAELLGVPADGLRGLEVSHPAWRLVRSDESTLPMEEHPVRRVMATGSPVVNQMVGIDRPAPRPRAWVLLNAHPVQQGGRLIQVVATLVDISERQTLRAQLATASRFASIGTLVAGVAHEINNPLTAVLADQSAAAEAAQVVRDGLRSGGPVEREAAVVELDRALEALSDADVAGRRIARIVKDLGLLGRPDPQRVRVSLARIVDDAVRWLHATVAPGATIRVEHAAASEVMAAPGQLAQVVINLVANAAKAMPPGRSGHIAVWSGPGRAGAARIEVSDDGVGIAPEVLERIFDPYFTTRKQGEGSGLGLSISKSIVEAHGGTIAVRSLPGEGTTITVELPAASGPA